MTLGKVLAHLGTKDISERINTEHHSSPAHTPPHLYYSYEPPVHSHATSKHHYGYSSGKKNNAAMSALTLLAFLFFLHILQQCLREHMASMTAPQVMVVSAAREDLPHLNKIDKSGAQKEPRKDDPLKTEPNDMTKIKTAQYNPRPSKHVLPTHRYRNVTFPDFV